MPMTSRQRITAALTHTEPDRTPIFEYVLLSPLADVFLARRYGGDPDHWQRLVQELGWEAAVRRNAADRVELAQRLGHDMLYLTPTPPPPSTTPSAPPPSTGSDPVLNLQQRNERAAANLAVNEDSLLVYRCVQQELQRRGLDLPLLAPAYAHGVWTDVDLMQCMALAPEVAHTHFALATQTALALIEHYTALGIEQIGIGGDFSGTRPLISPRMYRTFIVPHLRRLSARIHAAGAYAVNASDGDLWPVIDDFLITSGVDAYLEIDLHAGMDLPRLKAAYGDRITFYGNLDCGIELSFGAPDTVRQHTQHCLAAGWGQGGHILCASNAIIASIPLVNYLAMVNAYRDWFGLDRLRLP